MGTSIYSDDFKRDAVHQIAVRGYPVREVSQRLGVSSYSLYKWVKLFAEPSTKVQSVDLEAESRRLKRDLARVTEERDILKKASHVRHWSEDNGERVLRARVPMKYAFMRAHRQEFGIRAMCRALRVHFSGFYAWLREPMSLRAKEDARQTVLVREAWGDSGKVYGYRKLHDDLRDQGETCSPNRVARLASLAGITAQIGYRRRPGRYGGKPAVVAENKLDQQFEVDAPDQVCLTVMLCITCRYQVTDITYIRTHEGWLYLSVVIDLCSRRVVGWSPSRQHALHAPAGQ